MAHTENPKLELSLAEGGIHLACENETYRIEQILSPPQALQLLLEIGRLLNEWAAEVEDRHTSPTYSKNVIGFAASSLEVSTAGGRPFLAVGLESFPNLHIGLREDQLMQASEALKRIAETPMDIRNQSTN